MLQAGIGAQQSGKLRRGFAFDAADQFGPVGRDHVKRTKAGERGAAGGNVAKGLGNETFGAACGCLVGLVPDFVNDFLGFQRRGVHRRSNQDECKQRRHTEFVEDISQLHARPLHVRGLRNPLRQGLKRI